MRPYIDEKQKSVRVIANDCLLHHRKKRYVYIYSVMEFLELNLLCVPPRWLRLSFIVHLSSLLQAAFKLPQHVVGLMDKAGIAEPDQEHGVVVPLSLACRAPQVK